MSKEQPKDFQSVETRRNPRSGRRMTPMRKFYYTLGMPLLRGLTRLVESTYRVEAIFGEEHIEPFLDGEHACAPAYWHQHHVLCYGRVREWIKRGFKACFLISSSVDGEVPARLAKAYGAEVIRGSANVSGALALRDQQAMMRKGYSIVTTPDGPQGPQHELKTGIVVMARVGKIPIVPVSCAADRAWYLDRWDRFMIPKPFARVVIGVGEPYLIPKETRMDELEPHRLAVQERVRSLMKECESKLLNA